ncbi:hypothetical protein [Paenibacillus sp. 4624]
MVLPSYQRLGLGNKIMTELMEYITEFGFMERPNESYGAGMMQFIKKQ